MGGETIIEYNNKGGDLYEFEKLETRFFQPTQAYVEKSMQAANVQDFIVRNRFKKPVHMITGVKVATGAKVSSMNTTGFDMRRQQATMICS
jgi:hypothetical protein